MDAAAVGPEVSHDSGAAGRDEASETSLEFVEEFTVPSWAEHLLQHNSRWTSHEAGLLAAAVALTRTDPRVTHHRVVKTPSSGANDHIRA